MDSETAVKPKPRLWRSAIWCESINLRGPQLSSPLVYMRNSVYSKNGKKSPKEQPGTARSDGVDASDEVDTSLGQLAIDDVYMLRSEPLLNLTIPPRRQRGRNRRLVSSPPETNSSQLSEMEPTVPSHKGIEESHYCTMLPVKASHLINASRWENAYGNLPSANHQTADEDTDASFLRDIAENHLVCNICNQRYVQPKILGCLHSFCRRCLEGLLQTQTAALSNAITCPICRKATQLPENGLVGVQDNTQLQALMEDVTKHERWLKRKKSKAPSDEVFTMPQQFIQEYQDLHLPVPNPLAEADSERLRDGDSGDGHSSKSSPGGQTKQGMRKCQGHPGSNLSLFCSTCKVMICQECTRLNHAAPQHRYMDAAQNVALCRSGLESLLPMVRKDKVEFIQAANLAGNAYCRLHLMINDTLKKISAREQQEIAKIKEQGNLLRQKAMETGKMQAEEIKSAYEKHCDHAERAGRTVNMIKHALSSASDLEILRMKQELFTDVATVINKEAVATVHGLSFLDFKGHQPQQMTSVNLGKLLLKEKWVLRREFGPDARSWFKQVGYVAVFSNGDIAASDMETWQLTVLNGRRYVGHCKRSDQVSRAALDKPYAVAVNSDDELIVIDTTKVKVFDKDIKFLFRVPTSFPEYRTKNSSGDILSCLAVDRKNRIAVGNRGKEIVSLHQQDGQVIRTVPAEMIDTQLTISRQNRLIYSNYEHRKLLSVDFSGRRVFCVGMRDKKPTGVCCDNAGYIYVAIHAEIVRQCEVHQYNPSGVVIGCVIQELDNPLGMTFTQDDEIVLADKHSIKIFHRV